MKRYDLNLLLVLDALLRERSVSSAARRVGIGQPAMSAALARLRALFDDPILVREAGGMQPTARAKELSGPLRMALAQLGAIMEPQVPFDPATSKRAFRISGGDYAGMTVLPGLSAIMVSHAGTIDLRFRYLEKDAAIATLDSDAIDLALIVIDELPSRFESETLIEETFIGVARAGHPILDEPVDAARFAAFDHLLVTERGDAVGYVDEVLAAKGLERRIAITVPSAALVADILCSTNIIATIPRRAARRMAKTGAIVLFDLPIKTKSWSMKMVWAARNARDPALLWLRGQLLDIVDTL